MDKQVVSSTNQLFKIIAARRRALNMSQADLAQKLGITQAYISGIELGKRIVSLNRLIELLHVLRLDLVVQDRGKTPSKTEW